MYHINNIEISASCQSYKIVQLLKRTKNYESSISLRVLSASSFIRAEILLEDE